MAKRRRIKKILSFKTYSSDVSSDLQQRHSLAASLYPGCDNFSKSMRKLALNTPSGKFIGIDMPRGAFYGFPCMLPDFEFGERCAMTILNSIYGNQLQKHSNV